MRGAHSQNLILHKVPQLNDIRMLSMRVHKAYGVPHIELKYRTNEQKTGEEVLSLSFYMHAFLH